MQASKQRCRAARAKAAEKRCRAARVKAPSAGHAHAQAALTPHAWLGPSLWQGLLSCRHVHAHPHGLWPGEVLEVAAAPSCLGITGRCAQTGRVGRPVAAHAVTGWYGLCRDCASPQTGCPMGICCHAMRRGGSLPPQRAAGASSVACVSSPRGAPARRARSAADFPAHRRARAAAR